MMNATPGIIRLLLLDCDDTPLTDTPVDIRDLTPAVASNGLAGFTFNVPATVRRYGRADRYALAVDDGSDADRWPVLAVGTLVVRDTPVGRGDVAHVNGEVWLTRSDGGPSHLPAFRVPPSLFARLRALLPGSGRR